MKLSKTVSIILLAFGIAAFLYWFQAGIRFNYSDEGFLWYGASAILKGQVPLLDFQSYDPGRYYWSAAFLRVFGDRLLVLRFAASAFQGFALCFGLLAAKRIFRSFWVLLGFGLLVSFWMVVNFRYFDAGIVMIAVFFATRYAEAPSLHRAFQSGAAWGLIAFLGVNHALYIGPAYLALILFCSFEKKEAARRSGYFLVGAAAGLAPLWTMMVFVPGFFKAYADWIFYLIDLSRQGLTVYSFPVTWPWRENSPIGWAFVTVAAYYGAAARILFSIRKQHSSTHALFIASTFVGFFYLKHIFSRPDVIYLGEGIFPVLVGISCGALWLETHHRKARGHFLIAWIIALTLAVPVPVSNLFYKITTQDKLVHYSIGPDKIWMTPVDAQLLGNIQKIVAEHVAPGETLLVAPFLTTLYGVLQKTSPVWEIYFCLPQSDAVQQKLIRQMEENRVNWALVGDTMLPGNPKSRFLISHPLLWNYLVKNFEPIPVSGLNEAHYFLKRKSIPN